MDSSFGDITLENNTTFKDVGIPSIHSSSLEINKLLEVYRLLDKQEEFNWREISTILYSRILTEDDEFDSDFTNSMSAVQDPVLIKSIVEMLDCIFYIIQMVATCLACAGDNEIPMTDQEKCDVMWRVMICSKCLKCRLLKSSIEIRNMIHNSNFDFIVIRRATIVICGTIYQPEELFDEFHRACQLISRLRSSMVTNDTFRMSQSRGIGDKSEINQSVNQGFQYNNVSPDEFISTATAIMSIDDHYELKASFVPISYHDAQLDFITTTDIKRLVLTKLVGGMKIRLRYLIATEMKKQYHKSMGSGKVRFLKKNWFQLFLSLFFIVTSVLLTKVIGDT